MNNRGPLFSIVMPTRNRAELLKYALGSSLQQDFRDFEVIVSDNCSDDDTRSVVQQLWNSRVRYVRSDRVLAMPDSWEFALSHARGQYITFLCDDDAISPHLLSLVSQMIQQCRPNVLTWTACYYFHPCWPDVTARNTLIVRGYSSRSFLCSSRAALEELFAFRTAPVPKMLNSMCHKELLSRIKADLSRVFLGPAPDYAVGTAILSETDEFVFLDQVLWVSGAADKSIGAQGVLNYKRAESVQQFLTEFGQDVLPHVKLKFNTVSNHIAESILAVKERMPHQLSDVELDASAYFMAVYRDFLAFEENGIDTSREKREVLTMAYRASTALGVSVSKTEIKRRIRRLINQSRLLSRLESVVRPTKERYKPTVIRGEEAGFSDILECASKLREMLPRLRPLDNGHNISSRVVRRVL